MSLNTKSKVSSTSKKGEVTWYSPIDVLGAKNNKSIESLKLAGVATLQDLIWIFPNKIEKVPTLQSFHHIEVGHLFRGYGEVADLKTTPAFRARGKFNRQLMNITMTVKDKKGGGFCSFKWFNAYGSQIKKLKEVSSFTFFGTATSFKGQTQFVNPTLQEDIEQFDTDKLIIKYPTVAKVPGVRIEKLVQKIPLKLWEKFEDPIPQDIRIKRELLPLSEAFKQLHGLEFDSEKYKKARETIIYFEFFHEQAKIFFRRKKNTEQKSPKLKISSNQLKQALNLFPFTLTEDQQKVVQEVVHDLKQNLPMMRLVQGDVGSGKTAVSIASMYLVGQAGYQSAFMAPTETLATQQFQVMRELGLNCELLTSSIKKSDRKILLEKLINGDIHILVGTHSLIQEDVKFNKLNLVVIDEQHKFGVNQRIQLVKKGTGTNCLIMSATPIPRSLSLTQYGDLDFSSIKTMPNKEKKIDTRIVFPEKFSLFLNFLNTRVSMGEQGYVVVPAIEESEHLDIQNLHLVEDRFKKFFPHLRIQCLHGKMKADEKANVFAAFKNKEFDILISTSVIEVGIDVHNSTIMAIMNPERFGLSGLHQLRGRVGRGQKPGFCFLIVDRDLSAQALERLRVIENTTDGFQIAEEDLRIRGEGDLFGTYQSGGIVERRLASILDHQETLVQARADFSTLINSHSPHLEYYQEILKKDLKVNFTI